MTSSDDVKMAVARSQTIERAMQILTYFTASEPHLKLSELAAKLELPVSTVYRYVSTLEAARLLERDPQRGGYRLGLRIIELAGIALNQIEVRKQALDEIEHLSEQVNLLVNLGVLIEGDVLHIAYAAPKGVPRIYLALGRRAVAHCTAMGKVLLAFRPWEEVTRIIEQYGWRPYTQYSIQDFDTLRAALAEIQEQGYAIDDQERRLRNRCIAAPIHDYSEEVIAAISVSGTVDVMTDAQQQQILPSLLQAADRISLRLGYQSNTAYT